jgi:hypothetical protein
MHGHAGCQASFLLSLRLLMSAIGTKRTFKPDMRPFPLLTQSGHPAHLSQSPLMARVGASARQSNTAALFLRHLNMWADLQGANIGRAGGFQQGVSIMCDYSLQYIRSRPAKVGDKLTTRNFGTGTRGFAAAEDLGVAVCVLPGTELAFSSAVTKTTPHLFARVRKTRLCDGNLPTSK